MQLKMLFRIWISIPLFIAGISLSLHAQNTEAPERGYGKRLLMGLYMGAYFPNQYTVSVYDGYGFNGEGAKNDFANSLMYRRIVYDYGGGYGQQDLIAEALGVGHDDWSFTEADMPQNMRYLPGFIFGFNSRFRLNKSHGLLFNVNVARLTVEGNFTITINNPTIGAQIPGYSNFRTFGIKGLERRLLLQLGYQRIFDKGGKANFFYEGGWVCTFTRFAGETIMINDLMIDLTANYDMPGYYATHPQNILGIGIGMFGGFGIDIDTDSRWTMQLLYSPSYENLYFGTKPKFIFQQSAGLRAMF
jgi:hypothetical protein